MEKLALLLVDDQRLFVDNLRIVLESRTKDMKVLGIATDGKEAVELTESLKPAMILMDVRMPGMDGVEATRIILQRHPQIQIVMLTTFDDDEYVQQALRHGAAGYILKSVSPSELVSSIRAVRDGAVLVSPEVAGKLIRPTGGLKSAPGDARSAEETRGLLERLTPREREIVTLVSLAYDNRQIAQKLFLAEQTVKNALSTIFMKLGISRRTQLMRFVQDCREHHLMT